MTPDDAPPSEARLNEAFGLIESAPAQAREMLEAIVRDNPDNLPALRGLARALRQLGDGPAASRVERDAIARGIARPEFLAAQAAFMADDLDRAEPMIRALLRQDPKDPAGAMMLAEIAAKCDAKQEAENLFNRAILLAPSYIEPRFALAKHQRASGRYDEAIAMLAEILTLVPDHLGALSLRASIFEQQRRFDQADAAFCELHERHPQDARGWANHAFLLKTIGRIDEAVTNYRRGLAIDPTHELSWWGLSNLKTLRFDQDDVDAMRAVLSKEGPDKSSLDRVSVHYALGKALDDMGDYAGAFESYCQGAALRLEIVPYDPAKVDDLVARNRIICTPDFFTKRIGWGSAARDPIFIISLPRAGSTLVEQILSSHPLVEGTEELFDIERIALSLPSDVRRDRWPNTLQNLSRDRIKALGEQYMDATRRHRRTDRPFFTDKMPSNWIYAGLIHTILPNAKIVAIRRHPMGCGFANFSQHFNWGINFSYDLEHIAGFYSAFVRQMSHFDRVLPGRIHQITYESLVEDTEAEVRRLLAYLDLPFDEACLRFFENRRAVFTPSSEQVRSPINREGMDRWTRYAPFLDPLAKALGPVLDLYPAAPPLDD